MLPGDKSLIMIICFDLERVFLQRDECVTYLLPDQPSVLEWREKNLVSFGGKDSAEF